MNRLWLRSEGERAGESTEAADAEVLYGRAIARWWDAVAGVRHDFGFGGDPSRSYARISFDGAVADPLGGEGDGWRIAEQVMDRAAILMAFEQVGGADRALEMARDYALERMAFGRQIGSFQAIKHLLADMYVRTALARSATYAAAALLDDAEAGDPEPATRAAKLLAGEAAILNAKAAVQVLGGMGFTWAMVPHHLLKRAWVLEHTFGKLDRHNHRARDTIRKDAPVAPDVEVEGPR